MKSLLLVFALFCTCSIFISAQQIAPCGSHEGPSKWLRDFQDGKIPVNKSGGDWLIVPIMAHITGENDGSGYTSAQLVGEGIKIMNEAFAQAEVQFFLIDEYNYIDNSEWHNHETFSLGRQMMRSNNVSNAINIYFNANAAGNCGYYTGGQDAISINNSCLDALNQTLAHEMGHLLGLPHPFFGWEGTDYDDSLPTPTTLNGTQVEKTDSSNCTFSSDGFCGTPPDYLSYRWPCSEDGFSDLTQFDPDEVPFQSDGSVIMSYSTGECRTWFPADQIDAMCANITDLRSDILNHNREFQPLTRCGKVVLHAPAQREKVQHDDVTLFWEYIDGLDFYHLRVSKNLNFTDLIVDVQLNDTTYTLPELEIDRLYFWQVDGYAAHSPCVNISIKRWINSVDFSQTIDLENNTSLTTYFSNQDLLIKTKDVGLLDAAVTLYDLSGRSVFSTRITNQTQQVSFPLNHITSGVYLVEVISSEFRAVAKVYK